MNELISLQRANLEGIYNFGLHSKNTSESVRYFG